MPISKALKMAAEKTAKVMQEKDLKMHEILDLTKVILDINSDCDEYYYVIGIISKNGVNTTSN